MEHLDLSAHCTPSEAELFQNLLDSIQMRAKKEDVEINYLRDFILLPVIEPVLGKGVEVEVQGSYRKGTFWLGSDVDILIDTGEREVTRQEQRILTDKLKELGELGSVGLGCVAIHFSYTGTEYDLVFSNLADIGKQPPVSVEEMEKMNIPAVRLAALALKVGLNESQSHRVANFLLEKLVILIHSNPFFSNKNVFELFISVCQNIVDSKGEVLLSSSLQPETNPSKKKPRRTLSYQTLTVATDRISTLLHNFCLSRFFLSDSPEKKGFSTLEQIEQWLRQTRDTGFPFPKMPGWLFGIVPPENLLDRLYCRHCPRFGTRYTPPTQVPTQQDIKNKRASILSSRSFQYFQNSPLGKYVDIPKQDLAFRNQPPPDHSSDPYFFFPDELQKWSLAGSPVASRMLETRIKWLEGERLFHIGEVSKAIDLWAESLLLSQADADLFYGRQYPFFYKRIREAFERDPKNPNRAIVLSSWLLRSQKFQEAEKILKDFVRSHPNSPGVLCAFKLAHANQPNADWRLFFFYFYLFIHSSLARFLNLTPFL